MAKPFAALPALLIAALIVTLTAAGPISARSTVISKVPADLEGKQLSAIQERVARSADQVERELGGADAF